MKYFQLLPILLIISSVTFGNETAVFAGGCFWCTQSDFSHLKAVIKTEAGYDGGTIKNPTYQLVSSGRTHYVESVRVTFDEKKIDYAKLVHFFLRTIDVTQADGQFCDKGPQYRSVIFYLNDKQKALAQTEIDQLKKQFTSVHTEVLPSTTFCRAEDYHQHYAQKNPLRYKYYRYSCGRDARLEALWGKPTN